MTRQGWPGRALLCPDTPKLDLAFLQDRQRELTPELVLERPLVNPAVFADVPEEGVLKVLVYARRSD